jgi:hypothetical protein
MHRYSFLLIAGLFFLAGCGAKTSTVSGKVTYQGQPVTGGSITLLPVGGDGATSSGKPAAANVQPDGSFTMSAGTDAGGASRGQNRVLYSAPVTELPAGVELQPGQSPPASPFAGLRPTTEMVDVKAGRNSLEIELTK